MITVSLPNNLEARLDELAKKSGKTKEDCAQEAVLEYLQDLEDYFNAKEIMKGIKEGREKTTPLSEVMKDYGLDS